MNSYILLRNNKETGPFSIEALQQTGLKPTDLVWIECQSMNWRHPYEIKELKALLADDGNSVPDNSKLQQHFADIKMTETAAETSVEKKLVFVELPMGSQSVTGKVKTVFPDSDLGDILKYGGITDADTHKNEVTSSEASVKYSRPLDEIKEMYVKNLEQKLRSPKSNPLGIPKKYRQPVIYVCLILAGAGAGLFFKNTDPKKETVSPKTNQQSLPVPISEPVQEVQTEVAAIMPVKSEEQAFIPDEAQFRITREKTKEVSIKKSIPKQKDDNLPPTSTIDKSEKSNPSTNEKNDTKPVTFENISSKLTVHANEYVVASFGGIRNLEMTLQNNSNYLLDKVTVLVEYLNPEGIIIKTENIYFQSVLAGEKETLAVKKSKRGVKIAYKITKVESKDISSSTAAF